MFSLPETRIVKLLECGPLSFSELVAKLFPKVNLKHEASTRAHVSVVHSLEKLKRAGRITCEFPIRTNRYGLARIWLNVPGSRPYINGLKDRIGALLQGKTDRIWGYSVSEIRICLLETDLHPAVLEAALAELYEEKMVAVTCGCVTGVEFYRSVKQEYEEFPGLGFRVHRRDRSRLRHPAFKK